MHRPHDRTPPASSPHAPSRRDCLRGLAGLGLAACGAAAWGLEPPGGPVVLRIGGRVRRPNAEGAALFDMAMLERLPQASFTTHTPWYAGPRRFTGPLLRDVLAAAGAHGAQLRASALNDYHADLPYEDAQQHDPILARLLDGRPMAVRDKGPLFLIYPFDDRPSLRSATYYNRSVWQLKAIEVR